MAELTNPGYDDRKRREKRRLTEESISVSVDDLPT